MPQGWPIESASGNLDQWRPLPTYQVVSRPYQAERHSLEGIA